MSKKPEAEAEGEGEVAEEPELPTYRLLGNSGLRIFPLCLGAMGFGKAWAGMGLGSTDDAAEEIFKSYLHMGGNFIDTACNYQHGESEKMVGSLIKKLSVNRDELVIATKYSMMTPATSKCPNFVGNHKKNLMKTVNECLERLQMDYIDVMYVHWWDWCQPGQSVLRALDEVVRSGKVLHLGLSDTPAWKLSQMNTLAQFHNMEPFSVYQGKYSLIERSMEQAIIPCCQEFNVSVVPWGLLGAGILAGNKKTVRRTFVEVKDDYSPTQDKLVEVAARLSKTPAQVALRWAFQKKGITSLLVGARTVEQFEATAAVLKMAPLSDAVVKELEEVSRPLTQVIFPHNFCGTEKNENRWLYFPKKTFNLQ